MSILSPPVGKFVPSETPNAVDTGERHERSDSSAALPAVLAHGTSTPGKDGSDFFERPRALADVEERELGRGRSGIVYLARNETGQRFARKVFGSSGLAKVAQYVCLGSPNPYVWCESAIRCAVLRRQILAELVEFWFSGRLRVSRARTHAWNDKHHAFEMHCELIVGRHVALHHAYTSPDDSELQDVTQQIMKPLQAHLIESGFDGLVWQAGRGNPVALNNFMCEGCDDERGYRWAWIDLESGIPALIPMNPLDLLGFYLPKSFRHGGPLFDDVDVNKLRTYLAGQRVDIEAGLGCQRVRQLDKDVDALALHQQDWKSLARYRCGIGYHRAKGSITHEQAVWYQAHPIRWYARESMRAVRSAPRILVATICQVLATAARIKVGHFLKRCWQGLTSQTYRERLARDYLVKRIAGWTARGQLGSAHAARLRRQLEKEESSTYLTDFGVHLAIKPFVKLAEFWIAPALWMTGVIDETVLVAFLIGGGSLVRTLYTLGRLIQNAAARREKPWVALWTGVVPVIGNLAFPIQILFSGTHNHRCVARFIMFDTFARLGQWFPIWGGADTHTEHFMNRLPNLVLGRRSSVTTEPSENINPPHRAVTIDIGPSPSSLSRSHA